MTIKLIQIVARSSNGVIGNGVIGNGDDIPWKISDTTSLEFNKCTPLWILIFTIIINKLKV